VRRQELVAEFPEALDYRYDLAKTYAQIDFRIPGFEPVDLASPFICYLFSLWP
jgi:hypothetical protein